MGADSFTIVVRDGLAVLSFRLRPVDSNQRSDEEHLDTDRLESITIADSLVLDNYAKFVDAKHFDAHGFAVDMTSRGRVLRFSVKPAWSGQTDLCLQVLSGP